MTEQLRVVLTTYSQRTAFRGFAVALLPMLLLSYKMSFAALDNPALGYLTLTGPVTIIFFLFLGHHMKLQFASFRSKLIPGFVFAHFASAGLLIFAVAALLLDFTAMYAQAAFQIDRGAPHVAFMPILGTLWAIALLAFSSSYFFSPAAFWLLAIVLQSAVGTHFLVRQIAGLDGQTAVVILLLDAAWTLALVKRMSDLNESMFEYRSKDDSRESQRYWWSKHSDKNWLSWLFGTQGSSYLDRIELPLPDSFLDQVRHFEEASGMAQQSIASITVVLVVALWAVNLLTSGTAPVDSSGALSFFTLLPAVIVFSGLAPVQKRSLQSLFMLPLERTQIVSRYGCALFVVLLKNWLGYAAAGMIVAWMPIPGRIQGIPSAAPLLTSLMAQLPIFGLFSLAIGRSKGVLIGLAITTAALLAFGSFALPRMLPVIATLVGVVLTWLSYRRWCHAELVD